MIAKWFFTTDGEIVRLLARFESDDGSIIGDAADVCRPGESVGNLTYAQLRAAKAGTLVWDGHAWMIE